MPEDMRERAKGWAEGEVERGKQRAAFMGKLRAVDEDPKAALEEKFVCRILHLDMIPEPQGWPLRSFAPRGRGLQVVVVHNHSLCRMLRVQGIHYSFSLSCD